MIICISEPFRVGFVEATYTADESVGAVNICVSLTYPMRDILDSFVRVDVLDYSNTTYIPPGASLASEFIYILLSRLHLCFLLSSPAPDEPNFLGEHSMVEGTDFAQEVIGVNAISCQVISEERRTICYNQTIYDDATPETDEYLGLTLAVSLRLSSVVTEVEPKYDQAAILILDDDSEFGLNMYSDVA